MSKKAKITIIIISAVVGVMLLAFLGVLILGGVLYGIFANEKKTDAPAVEVTTSYYEDDQDNEYDPDYTFKMPDSLTVPEVTQPPVTYLEPTAEDLDTLSGMVFTMISNYNRNNPGALLNAYEMTVGIFGNYDMFFSDAEYFYGTPDPLNQFVEYSKFNAQNADWILRNVYGVEPDHNLKASYDWTDSDDYYMYYYNGYYYVETYATGLEIGPGEYVEVTPGADGIYSLKLEITEMDYIAGYKYIKARLKMVDGKKIWEIFEIVTEDDMANYY